MQTFWSLVVEPNKVYKKTVESGIHITRVALDTSKATSADHGLCQLVLEYQGKQMTVANLSIKHGCFQTELDLPFQCGEEICFTTSGASLAVTLTGLAGVDDDSDDEDYMVGESSLDELDDTVDESLDELEELPEFVNKKRKSIPMEASSAKVYKLSNGARKNQELTLQNLNEESLMSEDSDDQSYAPADLSTVLEDESSGSDEEQVDEEDDDSDMGEEEESDDVEGEEDEEESDEEMEESPVKPKNVMNGQAEKSKKMKVAATPEQKTTPKNSKVEKLKAREQKGATPTSTPKGQKQTPAKEIKKEKTPKSNQKPKLENKENLEAKSTPKKEKKNKDGKTPKQEKKTPKQILTGGVTIEDVTVGTGSAAKHSNMVSVYYEGCLKNGKTFDKNLSGAPFKFKLGKGEVIKGWDVGVVGMNVGGKRKISIPSSMGYGKRGAGNDIPPNSPLNFTVTLVACKQN